eukprot:SAG31_NODE_367_length_16811_cov_20.811584_12_plen_93_part_00
MACNGLHQQIIDEPIRYKNIDVSLYDSSRNLARASRTAASVQSVVLARYQPALLHGRSRERWRATRDFHQTFISERLHHERCRRRSGGGTDR